MPQNATPDTLSSDVPLQKRRVTRYIKPIKIVPMGISLRSTVQPQRICEQGLWQHQSASIERNRVSSCLPVLSSTESSSLLPSFFSSCYHSEDPVPTTRQVFQYAFLRHDEPSAGCCFHPLSRTMRHQYKSLDIPTCIRSFCPKHFQSHFSQQRQCGRRVY